MYVRLTGERKVTASWARSGQAILFRPPERKDGKIVNDSVYYVADGAWTPEQQDEYLGRLEVEEPLKDDTGKALFFSDGKTPRTRRVSAKPGDTKARRHGGIFEIVPDAEVRAAELATKVAKAKAIEERVKKNELPPSALEDYKKYLEAPKAIPKASWERKEG